MIEPALEVSGAPVIAEEPIRMVVLSDIHATESGDPITNVARSTAGDPKRNALTAARDLLPDVASGADCVICPGDLVDRGKTDPMAWVWSELHDLADALEAPLIATAGNHDMALRALGAERPNSALRGLDPRFPHAEQECVDTYWAHDFAIVARKDWRVLSINSSAQVGYFDETEAKHGRFSRPCLAELPERLDKTGSGRMVNVCVVHHHPQEWTEDSDDSSSHMIEGDRLIKLLEERPERWMLIHGHMHHPLLDYVGGGSAGLVRLSSGSVGANLLSDTGIQFRNQLHVVDFHPQARALGLMLAGELKSYDWEPGEGWREAGEGAGLAHRESFGYRRDGVELAVWLAAEARRREQRRWRWDEVVGVEPRCAYLAEIDRRAFFAGVRKLDGGVVDETGEVTFSW